MSAGDGSDGIQLVGLEKSFGAETVLDGVDLDVAPGEFCIVVGPSGSGKSTILKCITGLVEPDAGRVLVDGVDVTRTPVEDRDMGFVFQEFEETLFPHMTVAENVSFGLTQADADYTEAEIQTRVSEVLELLAIAETREDRPDALSGGQQQRVELARQLVRECDVMLFDDPLADLDYKLQKRMELELRRLHADSRGTYLYVTHNQDQALTLADKLVVINDGRVEQAGTPAEIYHEPANAYVGRFVGDSTLLEARVVDREDGGAVTVDTPIGQVSARAGHDRIEAGETGVVLVRPESVELGDDTDGTANRFSGRVEDRTYTGERTEYLLAVDGTEGDRTVEAIYPGNVPTDRFGIGDSLDLGWATADATYFTRLSSTGEITVEALENL